MGNFAVHFYVYLPNTCCLPVKTLIQYENTLFNKVGVLTF